jgi:hypothetical protein
VFRSADLSAVYFPHTEGLTLAEGTELLGVLLRDNRVRIVEIEVKQDNRRGWNGCEHLHRGDSWSEAANLR